MGRAMPILILAVLALVGWRVYIILDKGGQLRTLSYSAPLQCRSVTGTVGAEDLAIDHDTGWVYVSAFDRRPYMAGDRSVRGMIGVFSLTGGDNAVIDLSDPARSGAPTKFAPHGLSLYVGADGKKALGVVNHADGEAVEIFDIVEQVSNTALSGAPNIVHRRTVRSPLFHSMNDLVMVSPNAFYVTNDHRFPAGVTKTGAYSAGLLRTLEDYLMLPLTDIVYFDGKEASVAAKSLVYANGIAVSADGRFLHVAETTRNSIRSYARDAGNGALTPVMDRWGIVDLKFGVDNIDVAADGTLYVGGHPKLFALAKNFKDASALSPSQVTRLRLDAGAWDVKTVYLNDGSQISGVSVGARHKDMLVIGSIFGKDILVCPAAD